MQNNKTRNLALIIGLCGVMSFPTFAQNENLLQETDNAETPELIESNNLESAGQDSEQSSMLSDVEDQSDDFYIEPQPIKKGKIDPNGFAQKNTASIPAQYKGDSYLDVLQNEAMRLEDLPSVSEPYQKGDLLPTLRIGDQGKNVKMLIAGLIANGFMSEDQSSLNVYNQDVANAVKDLQSYYGIGVDGIAGKEVYRNLFIPRSERIDEIKNWISEVNQMINVGREEMKPYIVIVNIPSYTLHVFETNNKEEVLQSKVVVGKSKSQTPIGRSNIVGLKYNPTWTPPMSHIKKTVLPSMKVPYGMYVVDSLGRKVDPNTITSSGLLSGQYSVQQPAGVNNSLGLLKFETDSKDSIYLHDTNHRNLFARKNRALSMGCVRVQQWPELAALLANSDQNYIFSNVNKGKTYIQSVEKIPVFYTYSLVDNVEGKVAFYNDIYSKTE